MSRKNRAMKRRLQPAKPVPSVTASATPGSPAVAPAPPPGTASMNNPLLQQAEDKVESQITQPQRANYLKVVNAGMAAALANGPNSILGSLRNSTNPVSDCVNGAINLVLLLRKEARGVMPVQAMIPAMVTLMLKALDYADQSGILKVDANVVAQAGHLFSQTIFPKLGISPQTVTGLTARVHGVMQDPAAMEKINRAAGVVRDPNASTPTPLPGGPQ